tara:strand:+ start:44 stop:592 length:549 start_codon:yes stop_codon:yes gene_type:complete
MGIRIDGTSDLINASDGSLTIEGQSVNTSGMVTATGGLKIGTAATIHSTGQFNIGVAATIFASGNATFAGIVTGTKFVGDGSLLTGVAAGVWTETAVGVSTIKQAGINTTAVKGTATGAARSEGAQQVHGNISLFDGAIMTDATLGTNLQIPAGKNALLVGPVSVTTGIAVTVETNATLVII